MFNPPLAPHEIDAMPMAERVRATIEEIEARAEAAEEGFIEERMNEIGNLERAVDDLYGELTDLIDVIDSEDPDELEKAVRFAKLAIERNTP